MHLSALRSCTELYFFHSLFSCCNYLCCDSTRTNVPKRGFLILFRLFFVARMNLRMFPFLCANRFDSRQCYAAFRCSAIYRPFREEPFTWKNNRSFSETKSNRMFFRMSRKFIVNQVHLSMGFIRGLVSVLCMVALLCKVQRRRIYICNI